MKRIDGFTTTVQTHSNKYYHTIREADMNGFTELMISIPPEFKYASNKKMTILNFEAFYSDVNNPNNLQRSDCTELRSNIVINHENNIICLSGRGFSGYLYYDLSTINLQNVDLMFEFGNPLFPLLKPVYVVIQLLYEFF